MKKVLYLGYGVLCYCLFLGTIMYAIGFVGNLFVPKSIDSPPQTSLLSAVCINASLLLLFAIQHSVMARPAFKQWWTKMVPLPLERSTYVLMASACLILLMWLWQPMGGIVWQVEDTVFKTVLSIAYLSGWSIVFTSTFLINHFDLFGLRQVWLFYKGKPYSALQFRLHLFYKLVRHPLYFGFLVAFWATPTMSLAHLLFAILTTGYILVAIQWEERDLMAHFGEQYQRYKKWVPMLVPFWKKVK